MILNSLKPTKVDNLLDEFFERVARAIEFGISKNDILDSVLDLSGLVSSACIGLTNYAHDDNDEKEDAATALDDALQGCRNVVMSCIRILVKDVLFTHDSQ
jgi:hypothetical protein